MMAARRIAAQSARCPSCSVSLLNSFFGTQFRLPTVASWTVPTVGRFKTSVLSRRAFHGPTILFNSSEKLEDRNEILIESVTPRSEAAEEEFSRSSTEVVAQSSVEIVEEEFSTSTTETPAESRVDIFEEGEEFSLPSEVAPPQLTSEAAPENAADPVPWFLRVETPRPASHPFANRQVLPEVPSDAPPALEPLLGYLSEELGINDLSLIDLRAMDPPPAIGSDTIMIVGNARSERHLHISADRTCRWLRSEWKMAPFADGLLGRNEIKIKNRRLRKRGRLVSTQTGEEEGVGWICVDVGSQGLVVQLFTKHRREEIDLEGLWGKFLNKGASIKKATSIEEIFGEKKPVEDVEVKYTPPLPVVRLGAGLSTGSKFSNTQKRSFHSTSCRFIPETQKHEKSQPGSEAPNIFEGIEFKGINVLECVKGGHYWELYKQLPASYDPIEHATVSDMILTAQIAHLKHVYVVANKSTNVFSSRLGVPCDVLGGGPADTTSTEFLRIFHSNLASPTPTPKKFQLHLEFLAEAHRINPQVYPNSCFIAHLNRTLAVGLPIEPELYYLALRAICDSPQRHFGSPQRRFDPLRWEELSKKLLEAMEEVTKHMKTHCTRPEISIPEIQYTFLRAVAPPNLDTVHKVAATICSQDLAAANKPIDHVLRKYPRLHVGTYTLDSRLHATDVALNKADHPYTLREYQEMLLTAYAMGGAWVAFWNRWKRLRYMGVHRDANFFSLVIGLLVMGRNQNECVNAARWLPKDMAREIPGVGLSVGMARGMLRLVEFAEGGVKASVPREGKEGDWLKELKGRCEGVIERVGRKRVAEKLLA